MVNIDLINSRIIRILGNLVKGISIAFHKIFPNKRFTIPEYSAPLIKSKKQTAIPKSYGKQISQIRYHYLFMLIIYLIESLLQVMSIDLF